MAATIAAAPMTEQNIVNLSAGADAFGVVPLQEGVSTLSVTSSKQVKNNCVFKTPNGKEIQIPCETQRQRFTNAKLTCEFYDLQDTDKVEHNFGLHSKTHMKLLARQENVLECRVHTNKLSLPMRYSLVVVVYNVEGVPVTMDLRITNKK